MSVEVLGEEQPVPIRVGNLEALAPVLFGQAPLELDAGLVELLTQSIDPLRDLNLLKRVPRVPSVLANAHLKVQIDAVP